MGVGITPTRAPGGGGGGGAGAPPPPPGPGWGRRGVFTETVILMFVGRPFGGGTFLCGVSVFTISVKLLVRFLSVGVRAEGQKIIR